MQTIVYVDGYNLYYSLLRGTPYKWLNLHALFHDILHEQDPATELIKIKYYTAPVKAKFASHGHESVQAQESYHKALESTGCIDIVKGAHYVKKSTPLRYVDPPDKSQRVEVWSIEEKHTDVNIALDMYRDAAQGRVEQVVLCGNDIDLNTALEYLKNDFPQLRRGLIIPIPRGKPNRPVARSLSELSNWVRRHISSQELAKAQFKPRVPTRKKPADKPSHW